MLCHAIEVTMLPRAALSEVIQQQVVAQRAARHGYHQASSLSHALHASCRGLKPGQLQPPKQVDPLWTLKQNSVAGPTVQRLPSAAVIASITTFKEWPESAQVHALLLLTRSPCGNN